MRVTGCFSFAHCSRRVAPSTRARPRRHGGLLFRPHRADLLVGGRVGARRRCVDCATCELLGATTDASAVSRHTGVLSAAVPPRGLWSGRAVDRKVPGIIVFYIGVLGSLKTNTNEFTLVKLVLENLSTFLFAHEGRSALSLGVGGGQMSGSKRSSVSIEKQRVYQRVKDVGGGN